MQDEIEFVSVTDFIRQYPSFLNLHERYTWDTSDVGDEYTYPQSVHSGELYAYNGVVMELFIRKCICRKYGIPCTDERTGKKLWFSNVPSGKLHDAYQDYCNPALEAINIVDQIKMVALSHRQAHGEQIEIVHDAMTMEIDISNLESIMKYVDGLQYNSVSCKERCTIAIGNAHLCGVPDYIFDQCVICHVSTSMRETVYPKKKTKTIFYMLGHYCNNYYVQNLTQIYKIIIYNPLLGIEHKLQIKISPEEFKIILNGLREKIGNVRKTLYLDDLY